MNKSPWNNKKKRSLAYQTARHVEPIKMYYLYTIIIPQSYWPCQEFFMLKIIKRPEESSGLYGID